MSKRCPGHSGDTLGTLFGHSGARGLKGRGDTPADTPPDTPIFGGTPSDTPGDTRARRARETPVGGRRCLNYSISGYLRNLRGRLHSSEKVSEVFTLWVFTLKPFPENGPFLEIRANPGNKNRNRNGCNEKGFVQSNGGPVPVTGPSVPLMGPSVPLTGHRLPLRELF